MSFDDTGAEFAHALEGGEIDLERTHFARGEGFGDDVGLLRSCGAHLGEGGDAHSCKQDEGVVRVEEAAHQAGNVRQDETLVDGGEGDEGLEGDVADASARVVETFGEGGGELTLRSARGEGVRSPQTNSRSARLLA